MTVSGSPPYSWVDGTNLANKNLKSQQLCEAMQALTNRANAASITIPNWAAYSYDGTSVQDLGQTPNDSDLKTYSSYRHVNLIDDLRTALELVCVDYFDTVANDFYTISSLLNKAVGRSAYNRTIAELQALGYFDGEDLEEILKCINNLVSYNLVYLEVTVSSGTYRYYYEMDHAPTQIEVFLGPYCRHDVRGYLGGFAYNSVAFSDLDDLIMSGCDVVFENEGSNFSHLDGGVKIYDLFSTDSGIDRYGDIPFVVSYRENAWCVPDVGHDEEDFWVVGSNTFTFTDGTSTYIIGVGCYHGKLGDTSAREVVVGVKEDSVDVIGPVFLSGLDEGPSGDLECSVVVKMFSV